MLNLKDHIQQQLQIQIKDFSLIQQAFFHRSYVNEQGRHLIESNERLEFLGDAVLEILVSQFLFHFYPDKPEGDLSRMRAQLVREPSLAYLARACQFPNYIRLGKGEILSGGADRDSILSDCFEAFLGAVYLDSGIEEVRRFLQEILFIPHLKILQVSRQDFKTKFQELAQQNGSVQIDYRLLKQEGPAHAQIFTVGLYLENQLIATACGKSKKEAEMKAAATALDQFV